MNSDVVQSVLHLSSACADEARTPQLRAAGQITGVRPGMTDVLGERQRVQGARAPRWSGASALLRPLADPQLPPPSVGKRRHGVTGVLQADPALVTGSNAITWPVTRLTGTSSVTAKVTAPVILLCRVRAPITPWPTEEGVRRLLLIVAVGSLLSRGWLGGCELSELLRGAKIHFNLPPPLGLLPVSVKILGSEDSRALCGMDNGTVGYRSVDPGAADRGETRNFLESWPLSSLRAGPAKSRKKGG